jgi:SET domain-containing protein
VVSVAEAQRREDEGAADKRNFLLAMTELLADGRRLVTCVDGRASGLAARLLNHACAPSVGLVPLRLEHDVPVAALFCVRDLAPGEELTLGYGSARAQRSARPCLCAAPNCKAFLPRDVWT